MATSHSRPSVLLAAKIRALFEACGLSLADVARKTAAREPKGSVWHIPHNLYGALHKRRFTPSVFQIAELSRLTGYRFVDWFELFNLSLDSIIRFQLAFSSPRTVELDTRLYHSRTEVPWFRDLSSISWSAPLLPLSRWLSHSELRQADLLAPERSSFRFVKIGTEDAFAFPDLLPGSVVRIRKSKRENGRRNDLYLVRHGRGLACTRLQPTEHGRILLCPGHLPYASPEFEPGTEAILLGIADVEIRRLANREKPTVPASLGKYWSPIVASSMPRAPHVGEFLRQARLRCGLSFREASHRTRFISGQLKDSRYFCASSALSDYEAQKSPPRHVHKLISICSVYFASIKKLLQMAGIELDELGQIPMPRDRRPKDAELSALRPLPPSRFMAEIERRFEELPYFLSGTLPSLFGLPAISVRDVFWAGGETHFIHPSLNGAVFLVVDRRKKTPRSFLSCPIWAQPLYIFLRRDGSYLCGSCSRSNETLTIHPSTSGLPELLRLRNHLDAEVVGQVIGVVRRLE